MSDFSIALERELSRIRRMVTPRGVVPAGPFSQTLLADKSGLSKATISRVVRVLEVGGGLDEELSAYNADLLLVFSEGTHLRFWWDDEYGFKIRVLRKGAAEVKLDQPEESLYDDDGEDYNGHRATLTGEIEWCLCVDYEAEEEDEREEEIIKVLTAEIADLKAKLTKAMTPSGFWNDDEVADDDELEALLEVWADCGIGGVFCLTPYRALQDRLYTPIPLVQDDPGQSAFLRIDIGRAYALAGCSDPDQTLYGSRRLNVIPRLVAESASSASDEDIFSRLPPDEVRERARLYLAALEESKGEGGE